MKRRSDEEISAPLYEYDAAVRSQYGCFAGVDEAGRGPLCGPVAAAACILPAGLVIEGLNDSKKLTAKKRDLLFDEIKEKAVSYCVMLGSVEEINETDILAATLHTMRRAIEGLTVKPDAALIDGAASLTKPYHG